MAAVLLFWDTNMAAVTSCENTLYPIASRADTTRYPLWYEHSQSPWRYQELGWCPKVSKEEVLPLLCKRMDQAWMTTKIWRPRVQ